MNVSVVIPVLNEESNVEAITTVIAQIIPNQFNWDILFVDDGSTDGTVEQIKQLQQKGLPVSCLVLSKNYGHQAAIQAGIYHSSADVVITMDGDLQHPPAEIPRMLKAYTQGAEIVHMVPNNAKRAETKPFYKLFRLIANRDYVPVGSDFRLMSRRIVNIIKEIPEQQKIIRALSTSLGFDQKIIYYDQPERASGRASYTWMGRVDMAVGLVFNYTTFPLKLVFYTGLTIAPISFCFGVGHVITKLILGDQITPGFTDIIAWLLFLSGTILLAIGIIGKYLENILIQVTRRPQFLVKEVITGPNKDTQD